MTALFRAAMIHNTLVSSLLLLLSHSIQFPPGSMSSLVFFHGLLSRAILVQNGSAARLKTSDHLVKDHQVAIWSGMVLRCPSLGPLCHLDCPLQQIHSAYMLVSVSFFYPYLLLNISCSSCTSNICVSKTIPQSTMFLILLRLILSCFICVLVRDNGKQQELKFSFPFSRKDKKPITCVALLSSKIRLV